MPTIPSNKTLSADVPQILNTIRANASQTYQSAVPEASAEENNVRAIGNVLYNNVALRNEFLTALTGRIAAVIVTSRLYQNPWAVFKRGYMELGETIEEVFVNLATPFQYDPAVAEKEVFKRVIPDVRASFHVMNYQIFYKDTIQNDSLRTAFLSWGGVEDLIARIVDSMYSAVNYDEYTVMKYMLALALVNGNIYTETVATVSSTNMKSIVSTVKALSNNLTFMTDKYNEAGVKTTTPVDDQYVIINTLFDAQMDVEVLASAFNMSKADFIGHRILIDSFSNMDMDRLAILFDGDPTYVPLTQAQLTALDSIPMFTVDRQWFMIFDMLQQFTENYNGQGLYWNYFLHVWKTFSHSPFSNAVAFIPATPTVTALTVSPATVTLPVGGTIQLNYTVTSTNFASKKVTWASSDPASVIVTNTGLVQVLSGATAGAKVTITATSVVDSSVSGTCEVTVAS